MILVIVIVIVPSQPELIDHTVNALPQGHLPLSVIERSLVYRAALDLGTMSEQSIISRNKALDEGAILRELTLREGLSMESWTKGVD